MAEKTPAEKMRLKPGMSAALLYMPEGMQASLGLPEGVTLVDDPARADFILATCVDRAEMEERLRALAPFFGARTLAWIAYPKGSKAAGYDVNRDTIWKFGSTVGLTAVANVAIDERWSAMRMRPL